jgi:hypothetical protein
MVVVGTQKVRGAGHQVSENGPVELKFQGPVSQGGHVALFHRRGLALGKTGFRERSDDAQYALDYP